jgi:hypothetical protein
MRNKSLRGITSIRQKISVTGGAIPLRRPDLEEQSTLQYEHFPILGLAEPKENSLQAILGEYESEVLIPLSGEIEQLLSDRCGDVLEFWIAQLE